ncbi:MAG: hypothetical protein KAS26_02495, partial [Sulfurimonas sp.]|nr:hypothetical protein [Sulfurimonas sp.]
MKNCNYLKSILLTLLFSLSLFAQERALLKVSNPPNLDISDEDIVSFVVEADSNFIDWVKISGDKNSTFNIKVNPFHNYYC